MSRSKLRVCPKPGCPQLVDDRNPCPQHGRPLNAPWSKTRDTTAHNRLKRQVLRDRGNHCQRCGTSFGPAGKGSHMHHIRPGNTPAAVTLLCEPCHLELDPYARSARNP